MLRLKRRMAWWFILGIEKSPVFARLRLSIELLISYKLSLAHLRCLSIRITVISLLTRNAVGLHVLIGLLLISKYLRAGRCSKAASSIISMKFRETTRRVRFRSPKNCDDSSVRMRLLSKLRTDMQADVDCSASMGTLVSSLNATFRKRTLFLPKHPCWKFCKAL